jgi:hypothetical protein
MAPKKKVESATVNTALLHAIKVGNVTHVSQAEAVEAGLQHNPPMIEVNTDPAGIVDGKAPVRLSEAGIAHVVATTQAPVEQPSGFQIMSGVELPVVKRGRSAGNGGGGAPKKYPFDQLEVGQTFFVPATEKQPDPVKSLGSTISSQNMRYAEKTGETKMVERTKRGEGNKAVLDAAGNKVRETKQVDVYRFTRKFTIRGAEAGKQYGNWTAPSNGAIIGRIA